MIPTFKEFIKEGLWSKGVSRSKTGDVRQEDKDKIFYQPNVYPVTGYNDWFFELTYFGGWKNNKCVSVYKKPDEKFKYSYYGIKTKPNRRWMIVDKHNGGSNVLPGSEDYILVHSNEFIDTINNDMDKLPVKAFRFMKVVKEGLWSKGVERSKTGEQRIEDLSVVDKVCLKISEIISNYLGIDLNKNICTCDDFVDSVNPKYKIYFNIDGEEILKIVHVNKNLKDDYNHIGREITRVLFLSIRYDKNIIAFKKSIRVFEGVIDELKKTFKEE